MMSVSQTKSVSAGAVQSRLIQEVALRSPLPTALGKRGVAAAAVLPWQQAALGGDGPAVGVAQSLGHRHSELRAGVRLLVQEPLHLLLKRNVRSFT